jgi:hypothetical protein
MIRRLFAPLFDKLPAQFEVPGSPGEGRRLLTKAIDPLWLPFRRRTLRGGVVFGWVLVRRTPRWLSRTPFVPVFRGQFVSVHGRTILAGHFGLHHAGKAAVFVYTVGLFPLSWVVTKQLPNSPDGLQFKVIVVVALLALAAGVLGCAHAGWRGSHRDIRVITYGIQRALHRHGT